VKLIGQYFRNQVKSVFLYIVCTKVPLVYLQASELTLIPEKLNHTFAPVDLFLQ